MTFASLQARVNTAIAAKLTDVATVAGLSVNGIFRNGYAESFDIDGAQPSLTCLSADVSTAVRGTAVVVNAVSYTVSGIEPDGTGMTKLKLEKA